jgi:hypothetical protein
MARSVGVTKTEADAQYIRHLSEGHVGTNGRPVPMSTCPDQACKEAMVVHLLWGQIHPPFQMCQSCRNREAVYQDRLAKARQLGLVP